METPKLSPTYCLILDFLFKIKTQKLPNLQQEIEGARLVVSPLNTSSDRVVQEITIANDELWAMCTPAEWYLLGQIGRELKYGNALWNGEEAKKRSTNRKTIASLIEKRILIPTETINIYIINPVYIRKGDLVKVLYGTAELLMDCTKVSPSHVVTIRQIKGKSFLYHRDLSNIN